MNVLLLAFLSTLTSDRGISVVKDVEPFPPWLLVSICCIYGSLIRRGVGACLRWLGRRLRLGKGGVVPCWVALIVGTAR